MSNISFCAEIMSPHLDSMIYSHKQKQLYIHKCPSVTLSVCNQNPSTLSLSACPLKETKVEVAVFDMKNVFVTFNG